jgi:hypothetical protein
MPVQAYVSIRQHTSSIRKHTPTYVDAGASETYVGVCLRMLTYADAHLRLAAIQAHLGAGADGASETYADVC